jgi:hypothetical protein
MKEIGATDRTRRQRRSLSPIAPIVRETTLTVNGQRLDYTPREYQPTTAYRYLLSPETRKRLEER